MNFLCYYYLYFFVIILLTKKKVLNLSSMYRLYTRLSIKYLQIVANYWSCTLWWLDEHTGHWTGGTYFFTRTCELLCAIDLKIYICFVELVFGNAQAGQYQHFCRPLITRDIFLRDYQFENLPKSQELSGKSWEFSIFSSSVLERIDSRSVMIFPLLHW